MKCIMLAAGYATRLWPLTKNQPKALLDLNGKAMIEFPLRKVEELEEVDEVIVVTNEKFYKGFKDWANKIESRVKITVVNDKTIENESKLGAIGDLQYAIKEAGINDDVLVVNADNIFDFSLKPTMDYFKEKKKTVLTVMDLAQDMESVKKSGVVEMNEEGKVTSFEEKPEEPKSTIVSLGIYFYPAEAIKKIDEYMDQGKNPDKIGHLNQFLAETDEVYGYAETGQWEDIGTIEGLEEARRKFK